MFQHLRDALVDKLEDQRSNEPHCAIQWEDTKKVEVVPQRYIRLSLSEEPVLDQTYAVIIDGLKRRGKVLACGTKNDCNSYLSKLSPRSSSHHSRDSPTGLSSSLIDDLVLMSVLSKLLSKTRTIDSNNKDDAHDAKCAACGMDPIQRVDRYHCLECSSPTYDLCGRCFEKRAQTGKHSNGHAMAHFKLPNETLGIHFDDVNEEVTLSRLRRLDTLRNERHSDITCDGACHQKGFTGLRFKCDVCSNYNLCELCAIDRHVCTKGHQRDHPIILTSHKVVPRIDPNDIEMGEILGRGGFGYACKALWKSKNREVACKVIEISANSRSSDVLRQSFLQELAAYRELSGPYIVRTFAYATRDLPPTRVHGPKTQFMMLMELMGRGSLQNLLDRQPNSISLRRKLAMSRHVAAGMRHIHQHGMVHRDIRPDNILVTDEYVAKIGDLGIARMLDPNQQVTQLGCIQFMPPEFFLDSSDGHFKCNDKLDVFTFGLTLNQVFTEQMHDFRHAAPHPRITITRQSPILYDELISRCIDNDPKRRPTAVEIEKTLEFYEQAFADTMNSDAYARMSTQQRDAAFIEFYNKNKAKLQQFVKNNFPEQFIAEVPVQVVGKQGQAPKTARESLDDFCRIN